MNSKRKVTIFGSGHYAQAVYHYLMHNQYEVDCFFDNDTEKHGEMLFGKMILPPEKISSNTPTIIIASTWSRQISKQLESMGIDNYTDYRLFGCEEEYQIWKNVKSCNTNLDFFHKKTIGIKQWMTPSWMKESSVSWVSALNEAYSNPMTFPASLSPSAGELYRSLILNIAPRNIVEIGVFLGVSTVWAASAIQDNGSVAVINSIDLFDKYFDEKSQFSLVADLLLRAKVSEFVTLHSFNTQINAEEFLSKLSHPIDFLFIDGDHSPMGCKNDFLRFASYVSTGGYILLHDVFPEFCGWEGPAFVIEHYIRNNQNYELIQIYTTPSNYGIALIRKINSVF